MNVHQIVNNFHTSNTYILELNEVDVLLIDVGNFNQIQDWLLTHKKNVYAVILTHEHTDHCHGVNELSEYYDFKIFCSEKCAENIANSRQNFSKYIEEINTFEIVLEKNTVSDNEIIKIKEKPIKFIETPGHSPGSICILIENLLFTGDTILNGIKTPLNLPHSDKEQYKNSIEKLKKYIKKGCIIYPGHDNPFEYESIHNLELNINYNV